MAHPGHGEPGHVCPADQEVTFTLEAWEAMGLLYGVEFLTQQVALNSVKWAIEGDAENATKAAEANRNFARIYALVREALLTQVHGLHDGATEEEKAAAIEQAEQILGQEHDK